MRFTRGIEPKEAMQTGFNVNIEVCPDFHINEHEYKFERDFYDDLIGLPSDEMMDAIKEFMNDVIINQLKDMVSFSTNIIIYGGGTQHSYTIEIEYSDPTVSKEELEDILEEISNWICEALADFIDPDEYV